MSRTLAGTAGAGDLRAGRTASVPGLVARIWYVFEFHWTIYLRAWRGSVFSGFAAPALYLLALGYGLEGLVNGGAGIDGATYAQFVVPGVLAASAMQVAAMESTYPVMDGFQWRRTAHAMFATPAGAPEIFGGYLLFLTMRLLLVAGGFIVVAALLGAVPSWGALAAIPVAVLGGLAYAVVLMALCSFNDREEVFNVIFRLGITPMFLFSGAFFPISQLPSALQPVAYAVPLFHTTELSRALTLGTGLSLGPALGHLAYLLLWVIAGTALGVYGYGRRLSR